MALTHNSSLTTEQAQAMQRFLRNVRSVSLSLTLLAATVLLVTVLMDVATDKFLFWTRSGLIVSAIIGMYALSYTAILAATIQRRTGLKWSLLGEHLEGLDPLLLPMFWVITYLVLPYVANATAPILLVVMVGWFFVRWALKRAFTSQVKEHVRIERALYAEHWLGLGRLSVRDILFLRIPSTKSG